MSGWPACVPAPGTGPKRRAGRPGGPETGQPAGLSSSTMVLRAAIADIAHGQPA
jgi:hypothetical protein